MATCHICGNTADRVSPLLSDSGTYRTAHRISCRFCGTYDVTMMEAAVLDDQSNLTGEERYRLSAVTRNASNGDKVLELSTGNVSKLIASAPQPGPVEQMDLVLEYIAKKTGPNRQPVRLDPNLDYHVAYTTPKGLAFVTQALSERGLIERAGVSATLQYVLTMKGYERVGERRKSTANSPATPNSPAKVDEEPHYDLFICHASEDKEEVAQPLYAMLTARGYRVWYDKAVLTVGDSLRRKIDEGLRLSRFGLVILSPSFFAKNWPQTELDGLAARENASGEKVILPVWHRVGHADVLKYSPTLADKVAALMSDGLDAVVTKMVEVLGPRAAAPTASSEAVGSWISAAIKPPAAVAEAEGAPPKTEPAQEKPAPKK